MTGSVAFRGLQAVFTGIAEEPITNGAVVVDGGLVTWVGEDRACPRTEHTIDAEGMTLAPGLFDTHCHVHLADYTPRQQASGFLRGMLSGGVSQVISAGEVHELPVRDRAGRLALAILAHQVWNSQIPGMPRIRAGVLLLDEGLKDDDFAQAAQLGIGLAKVGFGSYSNSPGLHRHVELAKRAGMVVMAHCGPPGLAGGQSLRGAALAELRPDVYAHVNGGPTSLAMDEIDLLLSSDGALQLVAAGNLSTAIRALGLAAHAQQLHRVILGSETPSGAGVMPTAILRLIALLAAMTDVPPEVLWACASGTAAMVFGHEAGRITAGAPADLCLLDAPRDSQHRSAQEALAAGDSPAIQLMMIGGQIASSQQRNTPPGANALRLSA